MSLVRSQRPFAICLPSQMCIPEGPVRASGYLHGQGMEVRVWTCRGEA